MRIMLVEDKAEEQEKALAAVAAAGHEVLEDIQPLIFQSLGRLATGQARRIGTSPYLMLPQCASDLDGVITDLMFHNTPWANGPMPPAGLLVVMSAIKAGLPVVICTNAGEVGGHHAEAISWIFDGYVSLFGKFNEVEVPFGWVEDKDWSKAIKLLETMKKCT